MSNCQPNLLVQLCASLRIRCDYLTSYCNNREEWLGLVVDTVNTYFTESEEETKRPPITRGQAKQLFIRVMYLGGATNWYKDVGYKGTQITNVKKLCDEMRNIAERIVAEYPALHQYVQELDRKHFVDNKYIYKNPVACTLSLILGELEDECLMAAASYAESLGLTVATYIFDGMQVCDPDRKISAEAMSDYVFNATEYRTKWEIKPFDDTIEDMDPINDESVAIDVVGKLKGLVLKSHDHFLSYHAPSGLWKFNNSSNLLIQDAVVSWSMEKKIYRGFSTETFKPKTIDLGNAPSSERVTKKALSHVECDDQFLEFKFESTLYKIKFRDCVYDMSKERADAISKKFTPTEKFLIQVERDLPVRNQADVDAACDFVKDIFTLPGKAAGDRVDDYDFEKMPLWQFVILAIAIALAGAELKFMYAMIGQRNSGKGVLMTAIERAFKGGLVMTGHSANNLLGDNSSVDEAKKYLWLADPAIDGTRLLWTNEIKTVTPKGETFIDGNLVKGIASGGDTIHVRKQFENPYPCRHEITMFLNCNDLPPVVPSIGNSSLLRIKFPNVYVLNPNPGRTNEKKADGSVKRHISTPSFADGMLWLILDEFRAFKNSGQAFTATPEVKEETEESNEAEGQDVVTILKSCEKFEFADPFASEDDCKSGGFLISPTTLNEEINDLKRRGLIHGVSKAGVVMNLSSAGYGKSPSKIKFDAGHGMQCIRWVMGIKEIL
jgi:hypothetical protein